MCFGDVFDWVAVAYKAQFDIWGNLVLKKERKHMRNCLEQRWQGEWDCPGNQKVDREGGQMFWMCTGMEPELKLIVYIWRGQDSLANIWFTHTWLEHWWVSLGPNYNHIASASHKLLRQKVREALIQGQRHVYFSFREKALEKIKWINLLIQQMWKTWEGVS